MTITIVKDLIATLQTRNPDAQVYFMTQRKQPFENHIAGVVGREEMADQAWRIEPGISRDDVFLVTGRRIRPGSLSAWIIAEHRQLVSGHAADATTSEFSGKMAEVLTEIARHHLRIDTLEDAGWDSADFHEVSTASLRDALQAAYLAGRADRDVEPNSENGEPAREPAADTRADSSALQPGTEPEQPDVEPEQPGNA
jgi:hypothetical protein